MRQRPAIPVFAFYERLLMRLLFAWLVWRATPHVLIVNGIPSPNGITRLFDLHFLLDPHVFRVADLALAAAFLSVYGLSGDGVAATASRVKNTLPLMPLTLIGAPPAPMRAE